MNFVCASLARVSQCETYQRFVSRPSRSADPADPAFVYAYPLDPRPCEVRGRLKIASQEESGYLASPGQGWARLSRIPACRQETESNVVPAPGLEPGRPSFKGWWAANYPTPESEHLRTGRCHRRDRESTIPAGPLLRYQRSGAPSDHPLVRGWRTDIRHAGRDPAFDRAVEVRAVPGHRCAGTCPRGGAGRHAPAGR